MSDNVFALPGAEVSRDEPDPHLVKTLERWLIDAREGRLVAVAMAGVLAKSGARCSAWSTSAPYENSLAASLMALHHRFGGFLFSGEEIEE